MIRINRRRGLRSAERTRASEPVAHPERRQPRIDPEVAGLPEAICPARLGDARLRIVRAIDEDTGSVVRSEPRRALLRALR